MSEKKELYKLAKHEKEYLYKYLSSICPDKYFYDGYFDNIIERNKITDYSQLLETLLEIHGENFKFLSYKNLSTIAEDIHIIRNVIFISFIISIVAVIIIVLNTL